MGLEKELSLMLTVPLEICINFHAPTHLYSKLNIFRTRAQIRNMLTFHFELVNANKASSIKQRFIQLVILGWGRKKSEGRVEKCTIREIQYAKTNVCQQDFFCTIWCNWLVLVVHINLCVQYMQAEPSNYPAQPRKKTRRFACLMYRTNNTLVSSSFSLLWGEHKRRLHCHSALQVIELNELVAKL